MSKSDDPLESRIDDLYRSALGDFIADRNALAKTLSGAEAQRVKKLTKPTVVPWAVNQVYWRARPIFERVMKSGQQLRDAQVAALEGRKADVRAATEAHRQALADAVQQAEKIAAAEGSQPAADALMRTFETISLSPESSEKPGRLTKPLQPAGFEALSGVKLAAKVAVKSEAAREKEKATNEAERRKAEAARKKQQAEIRKAEAQLERARQKMAAAEAVLKRTRGQTS